MPRKYISAKRIPRRKPTTLQTRREATVLRLVIRNRRTKKADRVAALARLDQIAPRIEKETSIGEHQAA
jgi:hypothetical protein